MLPTGVLTRCAVRSHEVIIGVRWFRYFRNRKCGESARSPVSKRYYYAFGHLQRFRNDCGLNVHLSAGYCCLRGGKKIIPFVLADIGEGISEVTIKEWYVDVGDRVEEFDDVCEVESDKATVTITSRFAGTITARHYETGCLARVGSALVNIEVKEDGGETTATSEQDVVEEAAVEEAAVEEVTEQMTDCGAPDVDVNASGKVLTTPAVRRIAAEKGIDLTAIQGTGKHGRVLKEDLLGFPERSSPLVTVVSSPPLPSFGSAPPPQEFIPLTGYSKTMRNTMEASNKIPTFVITDEVDLTRLTELKAQMLPHVKLTLLPFLVKATSLALARHPLINSTASPDYSAYRPNGTHNVGVAIDTPLGLAVPNVKDVQTLTVIEVGRRLAELRERADRGKLLPVDVTGGTFTLSNMGSIVGYTFRPMILPPELAIGALGRMKYRPRYDAQDRLVRTAVMEVSWAADHRILDGATVARFSRDWKTYVENPSLILAGAQLKSEQ